ncbi:hypothetical protein CGRA01v4_06475 [Colletotrichum graminicola]|uniref:Uncharacterized protein n=1 Tax=Colletotrichum graminicola (strain M1.001 / M2 / FGSC 10212) TaxID=645133 RepID=E3Q285_COLGM|nr:uncharacterized protein GLRG_00330 [Colletotrichum graminicola M1.001]EFQ25186.1 hypothetical protein GLRG_00330 [Colletotrichum graminicola M1.001]WDK15194.1 hypothetical protein CGRA01v4_06475 [Colletotrichum graminicola]
MASKGAKKGIDAKAKPISNASQKPNSWHTDPYPCTAPRCIEVVKLVGQFMDLSMDYKVPDETTYGFYAAVIEELKAQYAAMAADSGDLKQKLSGLFREWQDQGETPMDAEVVGAVARMKIFMAAWTRTVDEIETLKSVDGSLAKPSKARKPAKGGK